MKALKVGSLVMNGKAVGVIAFCLFLNGMLIGAGVGVGESTNNGGGLLRSFLVALFVPYLLFFKTIRNNITASDK